MTAGSGIFHSEYNHADIPVSLYQIWIFPDKKELTPGYEIKKYNQASWRNNLYPVASGFKNDNDALKINTESAIYRCDLEKDHSVTVETNSSRSTFIYVTSGELVLDDVALTVKDQARISSENDFTLKAKEGTDFILIDVPE